MLKQQDGLTQQKLSVRQQTVIRIIIPTVFYAGFHYLPELSGTGTYGPNTFKDLSTTFNRK